jgi:hypothetical protein
MPDISRMVDVAGGILLAIGFIFVGLPLLIMAVYIAGCALVAPIAVLMRLEEDHEKHEQEKKQRLLALPRHQRHLLRIQNRRHLTIVGTLAAAVCTAALMLSAAVPKTLWLLVFPGGGLALLLILEIDRRVNATQPEQDTGVRLRYFIFEGVVFTIFAGIVLYVKVVSH